LSATHGALCRVSSDHIHYLDRLTLLARPAFADECPRHHHHAPSNQRLRDDGVYVSARQVCESTGIELDLLQHLQRAVGLPRIDDPDAPVLLRADAEAVVRAKIFIDMGADPDQTVAVMRTLMDGLSRAAAVMRQTVIKAILRPAATELELAQAAEEMAHRSAPQIGPMMEDLLLLALRNSFEKEAVDAAENAGGKAAGCTTDRGGVLPTLRALRS
jgi:adenylate cyclase